MRPTRVLAGVVAGLAVAALVTVGAWAWVSRGSDEATGGAVTSPSGGWAATTVDPFGSTAAARFAWGNPIGGSEFTDPDTLSSGGWEVFTGAGYQGQGRQRRDAVSLSDGVVTITGDSEGNTGAVGYYGAVQQYGRWEARIRIPSGDGHYHPVALLWPSSENWPEDGEIDYLEADGSATTSNFSIHHGAGTPEVTKLAIDRDWHTYAVEWTPTSITAYCDGQPYYSTTDTSVFPPGPMWHSFQLDWMGEPGDVETIMEIDWLRVYRAG